ncbi:MAG: hypothetical protein H5T84_08940 [Thermoleophilia bacterium]|nr:hypothetical protein [Thermoleophilia bacterium]
MKKSNLVLLGFIVILIFGLVAAAVGCGSSDKEAKAAVLAALDKFEASVAKFQQLGPQSTVADIKKARDEMAPVWNEVVTAAKKLKDVDVNKLETAWKDVDAAVTAIPDDATLVQAAGMIMPKVQALLAAEQELRTKVAPEK